MQVISGYITYADGFDPVAPEDFEPQWNKRQQDVPYRGDHQISYAPAYAGTYWKDLTWRPNEEFTDTLVFQKAWRGRSAVLFDFVRKSSGGKVHVMLTDFNGMMRHAVAGAIHGHFKFVKRGANYGCTLMYPVAQD